MASQTAFDPYYKWLGIPPEEQPPNHYRLLGLRVFESDLDVIDAAANRQMGYVRQCATGEHGEASQTLLNELSAARVTLLNPDKKTAYDAKLRRELKPARAPDAPQPRAARSRQPAPAEPARRRATMALAGALALVAVVPIALYVVRARKPEAAPAAGAEPAAAGPDSPRDGSKAQDAPPPAPPQWEIGPEQTWRPGIEPVLMLERDAGFCVLSELGGTFMGGGEWIGLASDEQQGWRLLGQSGQSSLRGAALPIRTGEPFAARGHAWKAGNQPIELIHERDGFPILSAVSGGMRGGGEAAWMWLDHDGTWWLGGRSGQPSFGVRALVIRSGRRFDAVTFRIQQPGRAFRLIHKDEGVCFLSAIGGLWDGSGDQVHLVIDNEGYWSAELKRGNDSAWAGVTAILFQKPAPDWRQLTRQLNDFSQWDVVRGRWESRANGFLGSGDSHLRFQHLLPQDMTLRFKLTVRDGLRPRMFVDEFWEYLGNEGDRHELFAFGPTLQDIEGEPRGYQNGQELAIEFLRYRELVEYRVDGKPVASGRRSSPMSSTLAISAGDWWSKGECLYSSFEVLPPPEDMRPQAESRRSPDGHR